MIDMEIKEPKIRVLGARVVILEEKLEEKTQAGIIVPGREKEPTYTGKIVAVGNGAMLDDGTRIPVDAKIGDKVVYNTWTGSPIKIGEDVFIVLNERDIIAIIEK